MRRKRLLEGDVLSDSSSSASDLPYPTKALMSSPLKAPLFSDAIGSSNGSTGHRKRSYFASFDNPSSSPSKRFRLSPTAHKSFGANASWRNTHHLAMSSPLKPRRQQHFTTSAGPDVSFFPQRSLGTDLTSPNFVIPSDDEDDLLPTHSFNPANIRSSPPRTPPMRNRSRPNKKSLDVVASSGGVPAKSEEGADLLLYLAASPSPAVRTKRGRMDPPSTPPPQTPKSNKLDLPSSMMMTPGGGNLFPTTPSQAFDFADFVNITPSPAQKLWKTPVTLSSTRTPRSSTRRRLSFTSPII